MPRKNLPHRKEERRERAVARQAEREKRSNEQQIRLLDKMLGKGLGAVKERARLSKPAAPPEAGKRGKGKKRSSRSKKGSSQN